VLLAGLPVPDRLVLDLARSLRALGIVATAETLEDAHAAGRKLVTLTIVDREAILRALADCPYGLTELRAVLLLERKWGVTSGRVTNAAPVG
jgi:hypothetical protein